MSTRKTVRAARPIPVRVEVPAVVAQETERVRESIMSRAFEIFERKGPEFGTDLENWLAAERELVRAPQVRIRRRNGSYVVEADIAGVDPENLAVQVTSDELLISAETHAEHEEAYGEVCYSEFSSGDVFRRVTFPASVDPMGAAAVYENGLLTVTAPVAAAYETQSP
jgi:HSP20 family molecular chaperone IbpA